MSVDEPVRLSKLMAQRGMCSRREADEFIERGWVFVDGVRMATLGVKILPHQVITLDERARELQSGLVTILLNKPIGWVSGQPEEGYRPAVELIGPDTRFVDCTGPAFSSQHLRGLAPAGRLDIDSKGLLIFTQDGRLAKKLTASEGALDKEYLVRVAGGVSDEGLSLLRFGLSLDDEPLKPAEVEWINREQLRFVIREGKKRQIRRMCEAVGLVVTGLKRVRVGRITLGKLPEGQWRYLRPEEEF